MELLYDADTIARRVREIGRDIATDYAGRVPVFVGILSSAATFVADLTRAVPGPSEFDFIAVSKFAAERSIRFEKDTAASIEGRDVIIVDDIIDTGLTLRYVTKTLAARRPASLAVCTLLDRPHRRIADLDVRYRAFEAPDRFVVGYGLDFEGRHRELSSLYAHGAWAS
ncbi:MAG: hypoxanthine phosphoribosyltransferase [Candidatus Eremiobacteraeota bacterium]|nr:hypoxanthine phosphoribosyltransferase [Candidatus Eremiobacteraeota bacterium]